MKPFKSIVIAIACLLGIVGFMTSCQTGTHDFELIPFNNGEEWGYLNWEGEIEINPQFKAAGYFFEGRALALNSNDLFGYIDSDGKFAINAQFDQALRFSEGIAWTVQEGGHPTAINTSGEVVYTCSDCASVQSYSEDLAAFSIRDKKGEIRWGYRNKKGDIVVNPQFYLAFPFYQGRAQVKNKDGKYGLIDADGKLVVPYQFQKALVGINDQGISIAGNKDEFGLIDAQGKYLINPQFKAIYFGPDNTFVVHDGERWGLIDQQGKFLFNPQFKFVFPAFSSNTQDQTKDLIPVQQGDNWGYANAEGKLVINPQFDQALPFYNGRAFVQSSDEWGIIGTDGKYLVNPQFKEVLGMAPGKSVIGVNAELEAIDFLNSRYVETKKLELAFGKHAQWVKQNASIAKILQATGKTIESYLESGYSYYYFPDNVQLMSQEITPDAYLQVRVLTEGTTQLQERKENVGWYTVNRTSRALVSGATPQKVEVQLGLYGDYYLNARFIMKTLATQLGFTSKDEKTDDSGRLEAYVRKKGNTAWHLYFKDNAVYLEYGNAGLIDTGEDGDEYYESDTTVADTIVEVPFDEWEATAE
jgi:hypothetical protein